MKKVMLFIFVTTMVFCLYPNSTQAEDTVKKNKFLVGSGVTVSEGWEVSGISSVAYSRDTDVKSGGFFGVLVPDESFVMFQYESLDNEETGEETKVKSTSIMGIWKVIEKSGFSPFISLSGNGERITSESSSDNAFNISAGVGTYFKFSETMGLYLNNVFEIGELSTYRGTFGIYLSR